MIHPYPHYIDDVAIVQIAYIINQIMCTSMGLLPDTQNCGLRIRRECWERFPRHRLQRKPLVSDPGMHYGTCVTHVPWYLSGSLTRSGGENVPGIPGACASRNFTYLARDPCNLDTFQWHAVLSYIDSQIKKNKHSNHQKLAPMI